MELYLLRHGEAGEAPRDEDRELTPRGHEQARAVAVGIAWLGLEFDTILTSPLPRARQTAEPVAAALGTRLDEAPPLVTGRTPAMALALLTGCGERVLLVGHEPQLSGIVRAVTSTFRLKTFRTFSGPFAREQREDRVPFLRSHFRRTVLVAGSTCARPCWRASRFARSSRPTASWRGCSLGATCSAWATGNVGRDTPS